MFQQRKKGASAPLAGTTKQSFRTQSGTSQLSDRTRRRHHTYHGAVDGRPAPTRLPVGVYSDSSEAHAAAVLETRNCFYQAALKYQRRGILRGAWAVPTDTTRMVCAAETDERVYSAARTTDDWKQTSKSGVDGGHQQ